MAKLVRTGLVYGNSLSCLVYLLGRGFVPSLQTYITRHFCVFLKLCYFLFSFPQLYACFKEASKLLIEYGCISPSFLPSPLVTRVAMYAKLLKVDSRAALCVAGAAWVMIAGRSSLWLSVECFEWWVILGLFAKWNWFNELIKFGRKDKNAWET